MPAGASGRAAASVDHIQRFSRDRTGEFRRALDRQRRATAAASGDPGASDLARAATSTAILPPVPRKLTPFTESAVHLRNSIRSLHDLLASHRAEYLNLHRLVSASSALRGGRALTDADRDALETEVSRTIVEINAQIEALKASIPTEEEMDEDDEDDEDDDAAKLTPAERESRRAAARARNNPDLRAHQHTLIILLVDSLRALVQMMASLKEQRTLQMKHEFETKHAGMKLRQFGIGNDSDSIRASSSSQSTSTGVANDGDEHFPTVLSKAVSSSLQTGLKKLGVATDNGRAPLSSSALPDDAPRESPPPPQFTASERAQLVEENHHLLDALEEDLDAIKRAERQMVGISELLTLFTSKVMEQEEQINTIYDQSIRSTLHVHAGIAQLKKAAQRGVTFRMMMLFMILMLSFSLLFLDWYMP